MALGFLCSLLGAECRWHWPQGLMGPKATGVTVFLWLSPSEAATSSTLVVAVAEWLVCEWRSSLIHNLGKSCHQQGGFFPSHSERFSFLRAGKCPANQRSASGQGLRPLQGPGRGHQAALAGPRNPGVLRQEKGVPAVGLSQIVSAEPRGAVTTLQRSFSLGRK